MNERERDRSKADDAADDAVVDLVRSHYAPPKLEPARRVALEEDLWGRIERSRRRRFLLPGVAAVAAAAAVAAIVVLPTLDGGVAERPAARVAAGPGGEDVAPDAGAPSPAVVAVAPASPDPASADAAGDNAAAVAAATPPKSEMTLARERAARIAALANSRPGGLEYAMIAGPGDARGEEAEPRRELPDDYQAIADVFLDF